LINSHPREIRIAGRNIRCDSAEDCQLLQEAKTFEICPADATSFSVGRLHLIRDACQRYSLGKHQRLANLAMELAGR
jgi:hypothetical protein